MNLVVTVDGVTGQMRLERNGDRCRFRYTAEGSAPVEGEASLVQVEPGIYSVLWDGRSFEAKLAWTNESGFVDVGGRHYAVGAADPRELAAAESAAPAGRQDVVAPMPGKVVRVLVEEQAEVQAGQGIVVVEAMKMQNEMLAPRSGRVVALRVREGATVGAGELLASIE